MGDHRGMTVMTILQEFLHQLCGVDFETAVGQTLRAVRLVDNEPVHVDETPVERVLILTGAIFRTEAQIFAVRCLFVYTVEVECSVEDEQLNERFQRKFEASRRWHRQR